MVDLITNVGEEWIVTHDLDTVTVDVGVYNDTTDALTETDEDPATAITTEPSNTNYARNTGEAVTAEAISGGFGIDNDTQIQFDFSDATATGETVDAVFVVANFQSTVAGDTAGEDHIVAAGDLTTSRDIDSIDTLTIAAGDLDIYVE